ncbi:MAG: hypothetical protein JNL10_07010 [Verrucomicrobiales bacterium]|nr:hypothetical protein [Verrucomicrobiales bacterium]
MSRPKRTLSFRSLLTATLLLILGGSVAVLVSLSTFFGIRNFRMLTTTIAQQTLGRVEAEIRLLLQKARDQNVQAVQLLRTRPLNATNADVLLNYLGDALEAQPALARMTLTLEPGGNFLQSERLASGQLRIRRAVRISTNLFDLTRWDWLHGRRGRPETVRVPAALLSSAIDPGDARTRTTPYWGTSYEWIDAGVSNRWAVRYCTPITNAAGKVAAVFSVSLALDELNRFLLSLDPDIPGYVAVFEYGDSRHAPRLIGHPHPEIAGQNLVPPAPGTVALDPVLQAYFETLSRDPKFRGPNRPRDDLARPFSVNSVAYLGSFDDLERTDDPPWAITMVLPISEVAGGVERNLRWAAFAAALFLTTGALVALWLARRISNPMLLLGAEARAMSRLDFTGAARPFSTIREVRQLEQALGEARVSLRSFQKYVPADVVRTLMESGTEARLGGHSAQLTLLFSDIVDFTHIAESTDPQRLVEQLGEYLAVVSSAIHDHGGIVDKFIGDGVMAFWGAPRPDPGQARRAAAAALEIQRRLQALNASWNAAGRPGFPTRIGINTGDVIVGNIGSEDRLNYTAVGDPVNLASRLESLNRFYGTRILISDATRMAAGDILLTRPVARVAVKGAQRGVVVHELLGMGADADAGTRRLAELTEAAFDAADAGRAAEAIQRYEELLASHPGDGVAVAQLQFLREEAPHHHGDTEWVRRLTTK